MTRRGRIVTFGLCGLLVVAGVACAVLVPGGTGQLLTLVLISVGLACATSLVFLEVGLSEDRERAREHAAPRRTRGGPPPPGRLRRVGLGRARDHPRRLE